MDFSKNSFKGKFREYQQRVLDNSSIYLADRRIHIVAAPGSGKTILGLELIRRLNSPCIILSPTITIRNQWKERFEDFFCNSNVKVNELVSFDLNNILLLNSITYQSLYFAINKMVDESEEEKKNYSQFDLVNEIIEKGIKTICLDEAHHLRNEWQIALDTFLKILPNDITIISLTATPPYDASANEWDKYITTCGKIDEEIFVPELVKSKDLCPHQDYIYFNYPTFSEIKIINEYKKNSLMAIQEIIKSGFISTLYDNIVKYYHNNHTHVYVNYVQISALLILLNTINIKDSKKIYRKINFNREIPKLTLEIAETAFQFLLDSDFFVNESDKKKLKNILSKYSLINKKKVKLALNEKVKRTIVSSCGKLNSIVEIVKSENEVLKNDLRLVILTDYIKKEESCNIGKGFSFNSISLVSIFDSLLVQGYKDIGCISGSLIILPLHIVEFLTKNYELMLSKLSYKRIENSEYVCLSFKSTQKELIGTITKLFTDGMIRILIGTQALLGEGWDAPCINSIILASYVGSFVQSNQMRGRSIRTYARDPQKTANIWHLVAIEPNYIFENDIVSKLGHHINMNHSELVSYDYEVLKKRFDCFVGPSYNTEQISNGIERISYIKPPFTKDNFDFINKISINESRNRKKIATLWEKSLSQNSQIKYKAKITKSSKLYKPIFINSLLMFAQVILLYFSFRCISQFITSIITFDNNPFSIIAALLFIVISLFTIPTLVTTIIRCLSPNNLIKSISNCALITLKESNIIGQSSNIEIKEDDSKTFIFISLNNASISEQNAFSKAIIELFSPIINPKYVLIERKFATYNYSRSFNCPSIFSNKYLINRFQFHLKKSFGKTSIKYTYSEKGRKILRKCIKKSFVNKNERLMKQIQEL